jgi:hypothetical protein
MPRARDGTTRTPRMDGDRWAGSLLSGELKVAVMLGPLTLPDLACAARRENTRRE